MDAIELMVKDHQAAKALMDEISAAPLGKRKKLLEKLKKEIEAHDHMEESIFYPTLETRQGGEGIKDRDAKAHEEAESILDELAIKPDSEPSWMPSFQSFRQKLLSHVSDEENSFFPKAKTLLSPSELNDLGERMQRDKEQQLRAKGAA